MKKAVSLILVLIMLLTLSSCGGETLSGKYVSGSGTYSVEFKRDGTVIWYQDGCFFEGIYRNIDDGWQLNIYGNGFYQNTVFYARKNGRDLVVSGGVVDLEIFYRQ